MRRPLAAAVLAVGLGLVACGSNGGSNAESGSPTATPPAGTPASPLASASATPSSTTIVAGLCANDFFPVEAGATWTYRHHVAQSTAVVHQTLAAIADDTFTTVSSTPQGAERDVWTCSAAGLADVEQHLSGGAESISFEGQTFQSGVQNFHHYRSRGVTIPSGLEVGSSWTQVVRASSRFELVGVNYPETQVVTTVSRAIGRGSVTTPAGTFDAVKVQFTQTSHRAVPALGQEATDVSHGTLWVVRGVGIVESTSTNGSGFVSTTVLVAYHVQ